MVSVSTDGVVSAKALQGVGGRNAAQGPSDGFAALIDTTIRAPEAGKGVADAPQQDSKAPARAIIPPPWATVIEEKSLPPELARDLAPAPVTVPAADITLAPPFPLRPAVAIETPPEPTPESTETSGDDLPTCQPDPLPPMGIVASVLPAAPDVANGDAAPGAGASPAPVNADPNQRPAAMSLLSGDDAPAAIADITAVVPGNQPAQADAVVEDRPRTSAGVSAQAQAVPDHSRPIPSVVDPHAAFPLDNAPIPETKPKADRKSAEIAPRDHETTTSAPPFSGSSSAATGPAQHAAAFAHGQTPFPIFVTAQAAVDQGMATAAAIPLPLNALAVEIAVRADQGNTRFEIRLDPPELGRIDVRLDMDRDGHVTSHLVVEKSETLDLLRRDAPQLERALQDAGLKTGDNGLNFSLRDRPFNGRHDDTAPREAARLVVSEDETILSDAAGRSYGRSAGAIRLDIRV